jgi:quercetin dioxygenase-like cupin family protein
MLKIDVYPNLEEAFEKSMRKDLDYILIRHSYIKGTNIIPHVHSDADEFVIVSKGHFKIYSEDVIKEFILKENDITVIYYSAGREHGLQVLGDKLDYFVLRSKQAY